ncbi:MAG: hypothetical protein K8T26_05580 [Lentisphaerae bacterium]|nr:hypothetical protein [Lentisphaerota bacterium]
MPHVGPYDYLLIVVVTLQATLLAYTHAARWKVFVLSLPFPFTVACLAVGRPVGIAHQSGLLLLLAFCHLVRVLRDRFGVPIVPAIAAAGAGYGAVAVWLAPRLPQGEAAYWGTAVLVMLTGGVLLRLATGARAEGQRTSLPLLLKLPAIAAVVIVLIILKQRLQGFMAMFPMVTVIAAYECRRCLWSICRQIPVIMLTTTPMMAACHIVQRPWGLGWGLVAGWAVFLLVLRPVHRWAWRAESVAP